MHEKLTDVIVPDREAAPLPRAAERPSAEAATKTRIISIDVFRGFVMFLMLAEAMRLWTLHRAFPESRFWSIVASTPSTCRGRGVRSTI